MDKHEIIVTPNGDPAYNFELFIDLEKNGSYERQIAVVGAAYEYKDHDDTCTPVIVPGKYRVLVDDGEGDLEEVFPNNPADYPQKPEFVRRMSPEKGMVPIGNRAPDDNDLLVPLSEDEAIAVRKHPEDKTIYVGILRYGKWWQNLLRIRTRKAGSGNTFVMTEIFSEYHKVYTPVGPQILLPTQS